MFVACFWMWVLNSSHPQTLQWGCRWEPQDPPPGAPARCSAREESGEGQLRAVGATFRDFDAELKGTTSASWERLEEEQVLAAEVCGHWMPLNVFQCAQDKVNWWLRQNSVLCAVILRSLNSWSTNFCLFVLYTHFPSHFKGHFMQAEGAMLAALDDLAAKFKPSDR